MADQIHVLESASAYGYNPIDLPNSNFLLLLCLIPLGLLHFGEPIHSKQSTDFNLMQNFPNLVSQWVVRKI